MQINILDFVKCIEHLQSWIIVSRRKNNNQCLKLTRVKQRTNQWFLNHGGALKFNDVWNCYEQCDCNLTKNYSSTAYS